MSRIVVKSNTIKELSKITDVGLFEKLATSVLRQHNKLYKSIIHTGINEDGVTVKDPLDGITFVSGAKPAHMIIIHHTITDLKRLKQKWLQDPEKVKQRSGTKTKPETGDLIKAVTEYKKCKKEIPDLECTLVLTSNRSVKSNLIIEVEIVAKEHGISIDIWEASKISEFLDVNPDGQYIRNKYLGIVQERLSKNLLKELSETSLSNLPFFDNKNQWIDRKLDEELSENLSLGLNFIVGESGQGKTVSCIKYLTNHVQNKEYGIIVSPEEIENANSVENLIYNHIFKINDHLVKSSGNDALNYTTLDNPFIILVEDINKSNNSIKVLEKIANWHTQYFRSLENSKGKEFWKILCSIWAQNLFNEKDIFKNISMINCNSFSAVEGTEAVLRKYDIEGKKITPLKAKELASDMGFDPFIIGLIKAEEEIKPRDVIKKFIFDKLKTLSQNNDEFISREYHSLLKDLVLKIYINHITEVTWNDIEGFGFDSSEKTMLKKLSNQGQIFKLVGNAEEQKVKFRHDRLQEWIASTAITEKFNDTNIVNLISEPYYSRIIGLVLSGFKIKTKDINKISEINPLSLFYSLKDFEEAKTESQKLIISNIIAWLKDDTTQNKSKTNLRLDCLMILSQTDSSHITEILNYFQDRRNWYYPIAGFRNGNIDKGIELCSRFSPGIEFATQRILIPHSIAKYRNIFIKELKKYLKMKNLNVKFLSGVLRLCGYIADNDFFDLLKESWKKSNLERREILINDYLWACAHTCGDKPEVLLKPIFDFVIYLDSNNKVDMITPNNDKFFSSELRFAFEKYIPIDAIKFLITQANRKEIKFQMFNLLFGIDNPDIVFYVVNYLAKSGNSDFFKPKYIWERKQESGNPMSLISRRMLFDLWVNKDNKKSIRRQSFSLWAVTKYKEELIILKKYKNDSVLSTDILKERIKRKDKDAIPQLIKHLKNHSLDWYLVSYIWSPKLVTAFDKYLSQVAKKIQRSGDNELINSEGMSYEFTMRLPVDIGEKILLKYWDKLKKSKYFILTAFYVATDKLVELATIEIENHKNPCSIFKYITQHYGIMDLDHPGVTSTKQLEVLVPFMKYLEILYIYELWNLCNEREWFEFRKKYLDILIKSTEYDKYISKEKIFESLNKKIDKERLSFFNDWIIDFKKTGVTAEEIIQIVFEWVNIQDKTNPKVLDVAIQTVWYIGNRSDFIYLRDDIYKDINTFDEDFDNEYYSIRRRTLQ